MGGVEQKNGPGSWANPADDGESGSLEPLDRRDTDPSSGSVDRAAVAERASTTPGDLRRRADTAAGRKGGVPDEHVGKTFGQKYRIDKLLAKGGMGRVYRATQFPLERPVAIKILNREFQQSDPQFVKRFFLEASIAAQLSNPHTITVFDYGESETGDLYIAMEYLQGRPLSRILRRDGPYSAEETLRLAVQICRALRSAHEKGVIHRDLKPGNIFILDEGTEDGGGYAKVLDFGLVKLFTPENEKGNAFGASMLGEGDPELTRTGTLLGSPKYMSPEQIQGLPLDPRTDIYSFGIILYQMVSGTAPFTGTTGVDVIYKHVNFPVPPISDQNPNADCPPELEQIIRRCLEKQREDRYASMDELLLQLKEVQKLVSNISLAGDSLAEVSAPLRELKPAGEHRREASFRELDTEPTPLGLIGGDTSAVSASALPSSRLPLAVAGIGFVVALVTLAYVLVWMPPKEGAKPPVDTQVEAVPDQTRPASAPEERPSAVATDQPEASEAKPPKVEEPAPAPVERRRIKHRRVTKKRPRRDAPSKEQDHESDALELPPNYRENPY